MKRLIGQTFWARVSQDSIYLTPLKELAECLFKMCIPGHTVSQLNQPLLWWEPRPWVSAGRISRWFQCTVKFESASYAQLNLRLSLALFFVILILCPLQSTLFILASLVSQCEWRSFINIQKMRLITSIWTVHVIRERAGGRQLQAIVTWLHSAIRVRPLQMGPSHCFIFWYLVICYNKN